MMDKREVRRHMRELKSAMTADERSRRSAVVAQRLEATQAFADSRVVLLYWSMADEVQTHDLADRWCHTKTVLLPCVDGDMLRLRQYTGRECLVEGEQFGIGEPSSTTPEWTDMDAIDVVAVPGVAFDKHNNRMGRGRGFYDRLLVSAPHAVKIGMAYAFQIVDSIPVEPHDVPMDMVVSDAPQCGGADGDTM